MTKRLLISGQVYLVGERKVFLDSDKTLARYVDANFRGEWQTNRVISLYGEVRNLLNRDVVLWQDYKELGLNIIIGMTGSW